MPHNRGHNQGRRNRANRGRHNRQPISRTPPSSGGGQPLLQRIQSALPTFHSKTAPNDASLGSIGGGYYALYKEATLRFHNWMANRACRGMKMKAVNDYRRGVDHIVEHNVQVYLKEVENGELIVAPPDIMESLVSSIRLRERVAANLFGSITGGDQGHQYIIDVLHYCRSALRFGNRVAAVYNAKDDEEVRAEDAVGGRFNALALDDDSEDEMDWEEIDRDIKDGNLPKYVGVQVEEDIDINEVLLKGDDRFQAMALLYTMDDLMQAVQQHYQLLNDFMRNAGNHDSSSCVQLVMECAVVANAATECVNRAENEMAIDHPHLSSFYHVLALVILTEPLADLNKLIDKTRLKADPHMALQFLAEIVECSFHNRGHERIPPIVKRFVQKSGLDPRYVDETAKGIHMLTSFETLLKLEERSNPQQTTIMAQAGVKAHTWLHQSEYIGGDCCILNTQKIVQMVMGLLQDNRKLVGRPGFWGPPFDENNRPACRIRGDLDEPFASSIIPEILEICRYAPFHCLPDRTHLITVLDLLQRHVKGDRTKPVPIALSFGLHSVLMSVFVLQGEGDLGRIAECSKQSYNQLFEQLQTALDRSKSPENSPVFYKNVQTFVNLAAFAKPVGIKTDDRQTVDPLAAERLAFWNPVIGGEYLLYATYICSIGLGSATVDSLGQLRFALHLYNGLRIHDPTIKVPLLESSDAVFRRTKAVWVGGKPEKGACCKVFWMSWGMSPSHAARVASENTDSNNVFSFNSRSSADVLR